ncbi:MAG: SH3 domain-containing protein [Clostridia bacterium]|nr:SH3 domain-containing protein [Clostridia bacterium]
MKRIVCFLLMICLLIPAAAFAEEHEYVGRMMVVNCKKNVSFRAGPGTGYERIDTIDYHTILENCWSGYGDYYYVEYYGTPGYVHKDYLEVYDGPYDYYYGEYYEVMQIVGAPEWTPLREMADVNAKQLAKLPNGAVVYNCTYYADDFTYVEYNGMEGYVLTEYITLGSENDSAPDLSVKYVTNCNEEVSLRAAPGSSSERLAWVPKNTAVQALDAENGYFYVCYEGTYGYISGDYLAYIGYTGDYIGDMVTVNCKLGTPLLAEPAPGFGWLEFIPEGTVLESCYEAHDGYYYAVYGDLYGYIYGDHLEVYFDNLLSEDMEYLGTKQVCEDEEWFALRAQPDWYSAVLKEVPAGSAVRNCYRYSDDFIYAEYEGQGGFIPAEYVIGGQADSQTESYESMRVVNCDAYVPMFSAPDDESFEVHRVPLGGIVTECERTDEFFFCCHGDMYGFIDGDFLEPIEGPYSDSDHILSNTRTTLNSLDVGFGVYLVSDTMGGDWSILQEKHHLENVLRGMPEEWWPLTMTLSDEQIIEIIGGNHLFLIIPSDEYASVTVGRLQLGADGFTGNVEEVLYESMTGEPFLLRCNVYDFAMDSEIWIVETDGDEYGWYPDVLPTGRIFHPQVEGAAYCDLTMYEQE